MQTQRKVLPLKAAARAIGLKPDDLKADAIAGLVPFTKVGDEFVFEINTLEAALAIRAAQGRDERAVAHVG